MLGLSGRGLRDKTHNDVDHAQCRIQSVVRTVPAISAETSCFELCRAFWSSTCERSQTSADAAKRGSVLSDGLRTFYRGDVWRKGAQWASTWCLRAIRFFLPILPLEPTITIDG